MTPQADGIPDSIEAKWQRLWEERETFRAHPHGPSKFYCYNPAPYVTGALHMGHVRNYTYGDFLSKFRRLHGANVLYTIGFDAFGVPTEVAAMQKHMDPAVWTVGCIERMKKQLARMGFGFDWRRSFSTADPDYYRWTQWIFIEMFREGLVYEQEAETLWCPRCEMALARSQTDAGKCSLCDAVVETQITLQWFLRVSRYLNRLRSDLPEVRDLNGQARAGQESLLSFRNLWGVWLIEPKTGTKILACMESPSDWSKDLVLAVHPQDWPSRRKLGLRDLENDGSGRIPEAGESGGSPKRSHDDRITVASESGRVFEIVLDPTLDALHLDQPILLTASRRPSNVEIDLRPPEGIFPLTVNEQKDFSISRQRLWGTPIPMVRCETCGPVPVADGDLPVLLPRIEVDGAGRLRRSEAGWEDRTCPSCNRPAKLDPQVMDCHFDALWHYCRPCVVSTTDFPFGTKEARYWMPIDQIQFGRDTIPFLLTLRLFTKFLMDRGLSDCSEFARETLAHGLILKDNRKMSKHIGNVVDPEEMISRFGADSLRFYVLARNEPKSDYSWSDASLARYHEMLKLYREDLDPNASTTGSEGGMVHPGAGSTGKYLSIFLTKVLRELEVLETSVDNGRFDIYARAVARILEALHLFRTRYYVQVGEWGRVAWWKCADLSIVYLAPIAPHLAEECWERRGRRSSLFERAQWPFDGTSQVRTLLEEVKTGGNREP